MLVHGRPVPGVPVRGGEGAHPAAGGGDTPGRGPGGAAPAQRGAGNHVHHAAGANFENAVTSLFSENTV